MKTVNCATRDLAKMVLLPVNLVLLPVAFVGVLCGTLTLRELGRMLLNSLPCVS